MFITFEANEGAGKTTQVRLLADFLRNEGHEVVLTREPGGSPGAEEIRNLVLQGDTDRWSPETEMILFNAARRDHLERTVWPALEAGKIVLCDRYLGSTLALQCAGGASPEYVLEMHRIACKNFMPDLTVFLQIDPEVSLRRGLARLETEASAEGRFEAKGNSFHQKVSELFEKQAQDYNWLRIDADQSIENVHADIVNSINPMLLAKAS